MKNTFLCQMKRKLNLIELCTIMKMKKIYVQFSIEYRMQLMEYNKKNIKIRVNW